MPTATNPAKPPLPSPPTKDWILPTTFPKKDIEPDPTKSWTAIASANSASAKSVKPLTAPLIVFINDI